MNSKILKDAENVFGKSIVDNVLQIIDLLNDIDRARECFEQEFMFLHVECIEYIFQIEN